MKSQNKKLDYFSQQSQANHQLIATDKVHNGSSSGRGGGAAPAPPLLIPRPSITNTPQGLAISGPINFRNNADILIYQDAPLPPVPCPLRPSSLASDSSATSPQATITPEPPYHASNAQLDVTPTLPTNEEGHRYSHGHSPTDQTRGSHLRASSFGVDVLDKDQSILAQQMAEYKLSSNSNCESKKVVSCSGHASEPPHKNSLSGMPVGSPPARPARPAGPDSSLLPLSIGVKSFNSPFSVQQPPISTPPQSPVDHDSSPTRISPTRVAKTSQQNLLSNKNASALGITLNPDTPELLARSTPQLQPSLSATTISSAIKYSSNQGYRSYQQNSLQQHNYNDLISPPLSSSSSSLFSTPILTHSHSTPKQTSSTMPSPMTTLNNAAIKSDDISNLTYIDLGASASTVQMIKSTGRLPKWLQKCTALECLVAKNLKITFIDDWVSEKLLNLRIIRLNDNSITTWPDHLAKLLPHKLTVIDLDGNPCMTNMFKKSIAFRAMYNAPDNGSKMSTAIASASLKNMYIPGSQNQTKPRQPSGTRLFRRSKAKKASQSATPTDESSVSDMDDDDDNDNLTSLEPTIIPPNILRKQSSTGNLLNSLSKYRGFSTKLTSPSQTSLSSQISSPAIGSPFTFNDMPDMERIKSGSFSTTSDSFSNKKIEPSEIIKSKIVFRLLLDIHELRTGNQITPLDNDVNSTSHRSSNFSGSTKSTVDSSATTVPNSIDDDLANVTGSSHLSLLSRSTSLSSGSDMSHPRLNSLDVLQHYLDDYDSKSNTINVEDNEKAKRHSRIEFMMTGDQLDTLDILHSLESLRDSEIEYINLLTNFQIIYADPKSRFAQSTQKTFSWVNSILKFHSDNILPALELAIERQRKNIDPQLNDFCHSLTRLHPEMHSVYMQYASGIEWCKRRIHFWLALRAISSLPMYGGLFTTYIPTQHPEYEIGEWIRRNQKREDHRLSSVTDYTNLPLERLQDYKEFLDKISTIHPNTSTTLISFENLIEDVEKRRPMMLRSKRLGDLHSIYKLKEYSHGDYICDANIAIRSQFFLEESSLRSNVDCIASRTTGTQQPQSAMQVVYNPEKPPKKSLLHIIVCEEFVLIVDEGKRSITNSIPRKNLSASFAWPFGLSKQNGNKTADSSSASSDPLSLLGTHVVDPNRTRDIDAGIRIVFHDTQQVWYCVVRIFYGDVRGKNEENCRAIVDAINS